MISPRSTRTPHRPGLRLAALLLGSGLLAVAALSSSSPGHAGETPIEIAPPTDADRECPSWEGTIVGNATATVTLELCSTGEQTVAGTLVFSSPDAGLSERRVSGEWAEDNLVLRDTEMVIDRPNPGWRFCLIDSYRLHRTATGSLLGEYDSEACGDHASVALAPSS